jgi:hypothetical protein
VQQIDAHTSEVTAIDPVASMQAIANQKLKEAKQEVRNRLARVTDALARSDQLVGSAS